MANFAFASNRQHQTAQHRGFTDAVVGQSFNDVLESRLAMVLERFEFEKLNRSRTFSLNACAVVFLCANGSSPQLKRRTRNPVAPFL